MFTELPLVEMARATSPSFPYAITWRWKSTSGPMSLARAVRIAESSRQVERGPRRPALRGAVEVGDDVCGVGGRAAVPEHEQLSPPVETAAQRRCGRRQLVPVRPPASGSAARPTSPAFISTERRTSSTTEPRSRLCSLEERIEEAGRTGAGPPSCAEMVEEDVDELPEQVVGASASSWRDERSSRGLGSERTSGPRR